MSIIRIVCTTSTGEPFELPEGFFEVPPDAVLVLDPPEACPVVAVCKEGIVVGYFLASKSDPTLHKAIIKDGPHPSGIVPRANAPTIDAEMTRMHQAMAAAFSR